MATTATTTTRQTFIVSFDPNNKRAVQFMKTAQMMDFLTVEKGTSPYNPDFVAKIERGKSSKKHFVDVSKLWD